MTLFEFMVALDEGTEVTVTDKVYDLCSYFYNDFNEEDKESDSWMMATETLTKLLVVDKVIGEAHVSVNFSELIERQMSFIKKANLFEKYSVDEIMSSMDAIIAGYVSDEWYHSFVNCLAEQSQKNEGMSKERFEMTNYKMTYETFQKCECTICSRENCIHREAFRRMPEIDGGLALCPNLNE